MKDTRIPTVKPGNPNTTGDLKHANQIEQNPYLPVILCIVLQNSEFFFFFFFFKEKKKKKKKGAKSKTLRSELGQRKISISLK
jgi:hypothetical protein